VDEICAALRQWEFPKALYKRIMSGEGSEENREDHHVFVDTFCLNLVIAAALSPKHGRLAPCATVLSARVYKPLSCLLLSLPYTTPGGLVVQKKSQDPRHGDQKKKKKTCMSFCVRRCPHAFKA